MLKNFLKGVFILVDINADSIPAPNSRKKKIIDIISYLALEKYTFVKGNERTTVKVYISESAVISLILPDRITSGRRTIKILGYLLLGSSLATRTDLPSFPLSSAGLFLVNFTKRKFLHGTRMMWFVLPPSLPRIAFAPSWVALAMTA